MINSDLKVDAAEVSNPSIGMLLPAENCDLTDEAVKKFVLEIMEGESIKQYELFESYSAAIGVI